MSAAKTLYIPFTQIRNALRREGTLCMMDSTPGAFTVCAVADGAPVEIANYPHDGTATERTRAATRARVHMNYKEPNRDADEMRIYERVIVDNAAPENVANILASLTKEEVETVSIVAFTVRTDIWRGAVSLRSLKAIRAEFPGINPYDSGSFPMTAKVWDTILAVVDGRKDSTCSALTDLEYAANAEYTHRETLPESETFTDICDRAPEPKHAPATTPKPDFTNEKAVNAYRLEYPEIIDGILKEREERNSSLPYARGFLALLLRRDIDNSYTLSSCDAARDVIGSYLALAVGYGVISRATYDKLQRYAVTTEKPIAFLDVMREALETGENLLTAIKNADV
ncbi:hypothetical protein SB5439_05131 [Klebsiella variicola]|uniref:hypothetical protein n=1 Tax=Klebsiella variicola TaxID=244366 RepID=UPI00109CAF66|nr:hypothetical protein [Klebsiella variicola]VGQ13033.1 hypothetical protein SB5439_05131 [Klebsiella variicola]